MQAGGVKLPGEKYWLTCAGVKHVLSGRLTFTSEMTRRRLLFIGSLDVVPTYGGPVQFHRHFIERNDFEFHKVIEEPQGRLSYLKTGFKWLDRVIDRASRTRFFPHFAAANEWRGIKKSIPGLVREARQFRPDAIVTIAHGCYGFAARSIASGLRVPLITFFYDWWPDLALQSRLGIAAFDRRMRRLYRESDLAFCVCEEMRAELGNHPNASVLFPIPAKLNGVINGKKKERLRMVYLGGMTRGYGRMISALCNTYVSIQNRPWELAIFGETKDWSVQAVEQASTAGLYRGRRYGQEAINELASADIFLVVMDFEAETRRRVRTSFPSKLLEYCAYGRPVVIWAPEYSSVARFVARNEFALLHTVNDPISLIQQIGLLARDESWMVNLANRAAHVGKTIFCPDAIHNQLVSEIQKLLERQQ
jgi:Glycosyl transferase 4-like domain/Glycosyl transferases group 1